MVPYFYSSWKIPHGPHWMRHWSGLTVRLQAVSFVRNESTRPSCTLVTALTGAPRLLSLCERHENYSQNVIIIIIQFINVQVLTTQMPVTKPAQKHKQKTGTVVIHETGKTKTVQTHRNRIHKNKSLNRQKRSSTNTQKRTIKQAKEKQYKYTKTNH